MSNFCLHGGVFLVVFWPNTQNRLQLVNENETSRTNGLYGIALQNRSHTVMFSKNAVITQKDGQLYLVFRVGNMRKSHLIETHLRVQLVHSKKKTEEGQSIYFYQEELKVIPSKTISRSDCQIVGYRNRLPIEKLEKEHSSSATKNNPNAVDDQTERMWNGIF